MTDTAALIEAITSARRRDDVARLCADLLLARPLGIVIDWSSVNHAIIERWSLSGLRYVKERAYKLAYPND
jgi:hypothetical protein